MDKTLKDDKQKEKILIRLRRIEGQIRGVQRMIEDQRDCREVVQQLTSVRSAVHHTMFKYLHDYANHCMLQRETETEQDFKETFDELIGLLEKTTV